MIAPDDTAFEYVPANRTRPPGAHWDRPLAAWQALPTDPDARFDRDSRSTPPVVAPRSPGAPAPRR